MSLEEAVSKIEGVKTLSSVSGEGSAQITIEFNLNREIENAANDARDKINAARRNLPSDLDAPVVSKLDLNAQAIMWMALTSNRHNQIQISSHAENVLKEKLQQIPGVGSIILGGSRRFAVRVWLDASRMASHAITALSRLCLLHYSIDEKTTVTRLPRPDARQKEILEALGVHLPDK